MMSVLRRNDPKSAKNTHALASLGSVEFITNLIQINEMTQVPHIRKNIGSSQKLRKIKILNVLRCSFLRIFSKMLT